MTELLTPQLFVSLILVIFVILVSLLCKDEEYQNNNEKIEEHSEKDNLKIKENEKSNTKDINDQKKENSILDKVELEKKIREEIEKEVLEKSKEDALKNIKTDLKTSLEALDGYITLFVSGKLGELNEEQKYTAELILKKSEQIKKIIE